MITARRLAPLLVLAAVACVPGGGGPTMVRPGSDMALPTRPTKVEKKNGETCVTVGGAVVKGDQIKCSPLVPDSTQRPPTVPPQH
jgi:hypothetical protein